MTDRSRDSRPAGGRAAAFSVKARGAFAAAAAIWLALAPVHGQLVEPAPDALEGVGIDEKPDANIPLELAFTDDSGKSVRLADFFRGERPVLLTLTYSNCPMLCHVMLNSLVDTLREMTWAPGEQFQMVNVSIDPNEKWQVAKQTKQKHLEGYGRPETAPGWHFLVGENVALLADAVGFRYTYVAEQDQYVHAAAIMVCTPDGRVSRYLYGVQFDPQTLKLSLIEAGQGKVGSTLDRVLLFCYHYDAETGKYGPAARRIMQLGAGLTLVALLMGLAPYWLRRQRARRSGPGATATPVEGADQAPGSSPPAGDGEQT